MTDIKSFALICWLLWVALAFAVFTGEMPWPLAAVMALSVAALWHLHRRAAPAHA